MADEKTTVKEKTQGAEQPKKEGKFITFCKNLPRNIATPFKNMWHELKQVTWPTKKDLINYTCIVLVFMVFMVRPFCPRIIPTGGGNVLAALFAGQLIYSAVEAVGNAQSPLAGIVPGDP